MNKITIVGIVLCEFLFVFIGCRGKNPDTEANAVAQGVAGRYHNQSDFEEYIDMKPDGMVFWHRKNKYAATGFEEEAGRWRAYGNELVLIDRNESVTKGQITGSTIVMDDTTWLGQTRIATRTDVIGTYVVENGVGSVVFNKNGTVAQLISGKWDLTDGKIRFHSTMLQRGQSETDVEIGNGDASGDVSFFGRHYTKQDGATALAEGGGTIAWSGYVSAKSRASLQLKKDGTFAQSDIASWIVEDGFLKIRADDGAVVSGGLNGNDIIGEWSANGKTGFVRYAKRIPGAPIQHESFQSNEAKVTTTRGSLRMLHNAVNQFRMDTGRWPTAPEGLSILVRKPSDVTNWPADGYLASAEVPRDGWGNDFIYEANPASGKPFCIKSLGADGKEGGNGINADLLSTNVSSSGIE